MTRRRTLLYSWVAWVGTTPLACPLDAPPVPPPVRFADPPPDLARPAVAVRFSPGGRCAEAIVAEIDAARCTVRVLAYSLTSRPVATVSATSSSSWQTRLGFVPAMVQVSSSMGL